MNESDPLMTIGVFARRSRLSPKALRLYERLGLLVPDRVDGSGYRRYRESQLGVARLIALLRRLDMPLAAVARVLAVPERQAAALVGQYWRTVERRVESQRELATHLRNTLLGGEGNYAMFDVMQRDVPEQLVLTEQRHLLVQELPGWLGDAMGRLVKAAQEHGGVAGPGLAIYHGEVNEDSDGPVEVCVPVDPSREASITVPKRREPAHREAYVRLVKSQVAFPAILSAYDAVAHWITSNGHGIAGSPREVYFADFEAAGPDDEVCDIAFPMG